MLINWESVLTGISLCNDSTAACGPSPYNGEVKYDTVLWKLIHANLYKIQLGPMGILASCLKSRNTPFSPPTTPDVSKIPMQLGEK